MNKAQRYKISFPCKSHFPNVDLVTHKKGDFLISNDDELLGFIEDIEIKNLSGKDHIVFIIVRFETFDLLDGIEAQLNILSMEGKTWKERLDDAMDDMIASWNK